MVIRKMLFNLLTSHCSTFELLVDELVDFIELFEKQVINCSSLS